jgi:hypothetical protein
VSIVPSRRTASSVAPVVSRPRSCAMLAPQSCELAATSLSSSNRSPPRAPQERLDKVDGAGRLFSPVTHRPAHVRPQQDGGSGSRGRGWGRTSGTCTPIEALTFLRGSTVETTQTDVTKTPQCPTVVALLASVSGPTNQSVARVSTETARRCPRCPEQEWTRSGESPRGLAQAIPALRWRQAADRQSQQEIPAPTQPVSRERFLTRPACDSA